MQNVQLIPSICMIEATERVQQMGDRRKLLRTNINIPGHIVADRNTEHCTIVDMSDGGARLHVGSRLLVPAAISLRAPDIGMILSARVVWRTKTQVGVRF